MRKIEKLMQAESIFGEKISNTNIAFLEKLIYEENILNVECKKYSDFSKPKSFFVNHQAQLTFLRNGKIVPFCMVDVDFQNFIAFKIANNTLYVYGYFCSEYDL